MNFNKRNVDVLQAVELSLTDSTSAICHRSQCNYKQNKNKDVCRKYLTTDKGLNLLDEIRRYLCK